MFTITPELIFLVLITKLNIGIVEILHLITFWFRSFPSQIEIVDAFRYIHHLCSKLPGFQLELPLTWSLLIYFVIIGIFLIGVFIIVRFDFNSRWVISMWYQQHRVIPQCHSCAAIKTLGDVKSALVGNITSDVNTVPCQWRKWISGCWFPRV